MTDMRGAGKSVGVLGSCHVGPSRPEIVGVSLPCSNNNKCTPGLGVPTATAAPSHNKTVCLALQPHAIFSIPQFTRCRAKPRLWLDGSREVWGKGSHDGLQCRAGLSREDLFCTILGVPGWGWQLLSYMNRCLEQLNSGVCRSFHHTMYVERHA